MKRNIALLLLALLLCLAGCGQEECAHQWSDASCEMPKICTLCGTIDGQALGHSWQAADCDTAQTCTVCQKTQGQPNGHSWQAADCHTPKTCSVCALVEGDVADHVWIPANFQSPAICQACGHSEGDCLQPKFEGYPVNVTTVQLGVQYDYLAACYVQGYTTLGKLWWEDYQVFDSDQNHEALDGYQWHSVTLRIEFSDRNAQKYGFVVQTALDDYYWYTAQTGNGYTDQFTVSYNGQLYDQCLRANGQGSVSEWVDNTCIYTATFAWRVPVGYDGHLILLHNGAGDLEEMLQNGSENILVFKLD